MRGNCAACLSLFWRRIPWGTWSTLATHLFTASWVQKPCGVDLPKSRPVENMFEVWFLVDFANYWEIRLWKFKNQSGEALETMWADSFLALMWMLKYSWTYFFCLGVLFLCTLKDSWAGPDFIEPLWLVYFCYSELRVAESEVERRWRESGGQTLGTRHWG